MIKGNLPTTTHTLDINNLTMTRKLTLAMNRATTTPPTKIRTILNSKNQLPNKHLTLYNSYSEYNPASQASTRS